MIYLDMDGVFADFDGHHEKLFGRRPTRWPNPDTANWGAINRAGDFFRTMPVMADAPELLRFVVDELGERPMFLTGVAPSITDMKRQKQEWAAEHFPGIPVIGCPARVKCRYCEQGDVLVDDMLKYRVDWERVGGVFIHHTSADNSIRELRQWYESLSHVSS
jgi:5'(3')-deoxyribonucleotidase